MKISEFELIFRQSYAFCLSSLKSRYRKTLAGFVWVLLNPLLMFGVQSIVFKKILKIPVPDFYLFLVGGLIPWIFISQTICMSASILTANSGILKAFRLNPLVLVNSSYFDNLFNFFIATVIITTPVLIFSDLGPQWGVLLAPLALVPMIIGSFALSSLVAVLNVFYRDTSYVLNFIFSIFFFVTPIFYPIEFVPLEFHWMIEINPFYHLINPYRFTLYQPLSMALIPLMLKAFGWALGLSAVSALYWRKKKNELFISI